jgi:hypothetical protein
VLITQTEIHIDGNNNYYEVSTYSTTAGPSKPNGQAQAERKALEKAEINLNDCLACRSAMCLMKSKRKADKSVDVSPLPNQC